MKRFRSETMNDETTTISDYKALYCSTHFPWKPLTSNFTSCSDGLLLIIKREREYDREENVLSLYS